MKYELQCSCMLHEMTLKWVNDSFNLTWPVPEYNQILDEFLKQKLHPGSSESEAGGHNLRVFPGTVADGSAIM